MPANPFFSRLVAARFRGDKVRKILDDQAARTKTRVRRNKTRYIRGTHNGYFFRIKVPTAKKNIPSVPKLHTPTSPPMRLTPITDSTGTRTQRSNFWYRLHAWLLENHSTLILNFGSVCTLVGFTRSDVLELRQLSVTGSVCAVLYHLTSPPVRMPPILWSATFAVVNSWKIFEILHERKGSVKLTEEQEECYIDFFMPHGCTPKQFEAIYEKAELVDVKKNTLLIRQGEELDHVYLVISGTTRASVLGRFLTAVSTTPTAHEERKGGASGAWIGEMAVLECVWLKDQGRPPPRGDNTVTQPGDSSKIGEHSAETKEPVLVSNRAMYTIVAQEDCLVLRWSHNQMQALMERSTDMRAALTRAMTAAIVGKVINFTVSRSATKATWSTWLDDWKHNAGAEIQIEREPSSVGDECESENHGEPPPMKENLPRYPIKAFR